MNKKFLNILLILIVSLSVLCGCSAGENNFFNDLDITAQSASDYQIMIYLIFPIMTVRLMLN